ncbi:hypothetical protein RB595_000702 [Gaeumannomyces hyphopodioides]
MSNVSADLIWEVVRSQNAFLEKRKTGGGIQFSRDPLNLVNKHSRKAIGVQAAEKGGVVVTSKKADAANKPTSQLSSVTHHGGKSARSTYKAVANRTAKNGYRPDLRQAAVARASAIRKSQRTPKDEPEKKLRGNAAKKAAE